MLSNQDFSLIINDTTKRINVNINWNNETNNKNCCKFRVNIESESDYPLILNGTYNLIYPGLSYTIIHKGIGKRIYGLDIGKTHPNPNG